MSTTLGELNVVIGADIGRFASAATTVEQGLGRIGDAADRAAGRYTDAQGRMREANGRFVSSATLAAEAAGKLGGSLASAANGFDRFNASLVTGFKAYDKAFDPLDEGIGRFGRGVKDVGGSLTTYVTLPLTLLGGVALTAFGQIEKLGKGLNAVAEQEINAKGATGIVAIAQAATETGERLKELEGLAKAPGLGFSQAVQGDIRLRAVGISAEQSAKSIKEFANAIATTGGGRNEFSSVTTQLGQLSAKGKVLAQDLRPIIEAAPAVATALQKLYGTVDSEDISKALAKQGKSSQDFIAILTDELAKLPRVAGGFQDTLENFQEAGTRSLAKFGASLNKAFSLDANLAELGDYLTGLADKFDALDPATQKLVFGLAAGAAAAGPLLYGLGSILAAVPEMVAGFALISTAVQGGGAALLTFATGPVGIALAAVAALAAGIYYLSTASDRSLDAFQNQAAKTDALVGSVTPLLARYTELSEKTNRSAAEQTELATIIKQLAADVPGATTAIDAYGNATAISGEAVAEFTKALLAQKAANAALNLPDATKKLDELSTRYDVLKRQQDEFNKTGSIKVATFDSGGGSLDSYGAGSKAVLELQANLANANIEFLKQKQLVDDLRGATQGLAETDDSLSNALHGMEFGSLAAAQAIPLLATLRERLKEVKEQRETESTEKAVFADNKLIVSLEAQIKRLEGVDKASKKATDAFAKLRAELAALSALDNIVARPADGLQVVERRISAIQAGLKGLLEAGVSPSNVEFKELAKQALVLGQGLAKLKADTDVPFKVVAVKTGDTLGEVNKAFLGTEFQDLKVSVPVRLDLKKTDFSQDFLNVSIALDKAFSRNAASSIAFGQSFNQAGADADALRSKMEDLINDGVDPLSPAFQRLKVSYDDSMKSARATADANSAQLESARALQQGVISLASGVADAFGGALSGVQGFGEALTQTLLSTVSSVAGQLGGILLAAGLGIDAFKMSLATFQGAGAIAAGIGLLAIAGIAKGASASLASSGGSTSTAARGQSSYSPTVSQSNLQNTIRVEVTGRLTSSAGALSAVIEADAYRRRRTQG